MVNNPMSTAPGHATPRPKVGERKNCERGAGHYDDDDESPASPCSGPGGM